MDIESIREFCLNLEGTEESLPFGPDVVVFKVNGKIYLLLPLDTDDVQFNVKCDPELAIQLREEYPAVQPGYHMNKKHWNTVHADGSVSNATLKEWIQHSYNLISKSKKKK